MRADRRDRLRGQSGLRQERLHHLGIGPDQAIGRKRHAVQLIGGGGVERKQLCPQRSRKRGECMFAHRRLARAEASSTPSTPSSEVPDISPISNSVDSGKD